MSKEIVSTDRAPAAIGPYSQAVKANGFVFTSGVIPVDPATAKVVDGEITEQATQVFENLKAVLAASGSSLDRAVKTTCFLADLNDFATFNGDLRHLLFVRPAGSFHRSGRQVATRGPGRSGVRGAALAVDPPVWLELD